MLNPFNSISFGALFYHATNSLNQFSFQFLCHSIQIQVTIRTSLQLIRKRIPSICWRRNSELNHRKILPSHWQNISCRNIVTWRRHMCTCKNILGNVFVIRMQKIKRHSITMRSSLRPLQSDIAMLYIKELVSISLNYYYYCYYQFENETRQSLWHISDDFKCKWAHTHSHAHTYTENTKKRDNLKRNIFFERSLAIYLFNLCHAIHKLFQ